MPSRRKKDRHYLFSELGQEHQDEIVGNLGRTIAEKTVWVLIPNFPVAQAAEIAWDTSAIIFDYDVESAMAQIELRGKVLRPILVDELDEENVWMEGRHRAIASERLGLKTIPALYRIK